MPIFDQTHGKNGKFSTKLKLHFYGLKSLVFYLKHDHTRYPGVLKRKETFKENANF